MNQQTEPTIIECLVEALGLPKEDAEILKAEVVRTIGLEAFTLFITKAPQADLEQFMKDITSIKDPTEALNRVREFADAHPETIEAMQEYFDKTLPEFFIQLTRSFLEKATPAQKQAFSQLSGVTI